MAQRLEEWRNLLVDQFRLLKQAEWDRVIKRFGGQANAENDADEFIRSLEGIDRKLINGTCPLLSAYQREEIEAGRISQLVMKVNGTRLVLHSKVGKGGQGDVFKAVLSLPGGKREFVALKEASFDTDDEQLRIQQESRTLCADRGGSEDGMFVVQGRFSFEPSRRKSILVMDWIEGVTLQRHVDRCFESSGRPSLLATLENAESVAKGLRFLHQRGLIHRDLKPANIVLQPLTAVNALRPVVVDLGLVKNVNNAMTLKGFRCGTPYYSAPECFIDASRADEKADIFSLAAVMYFMLTGKPPRCELYLQFGMGVALPQKAQMDFNFWNGRESLPVPLDLKSIRPELPESFCAVLQRNLSPVPAPRHSSVDEFMSEIEPLRKDLDHLRSVHRILRKLQMIIRNAMNKCCEYCDTLPVDQNFLELYRNLSGVFRGRFNLDPAFPNKCQISEQFVGAGEFNIALKTMGDDFISIVEEVGRIARDPTARGAAASNLHLASLTNWQLFLPRLLTVEHQLLQVMHGLV